jgi:hypothetical protein
MRLLFIICEANVDERIMEMIMEAGGTGYTRFTDAFGNGSHGRREGSPVWPGLNSVIIAAMPDENVQGLTDRIKALQAERSGRLGVRVFAAPAEQLV